MLVVCAFVVEERVATTDDVTELAFDDLPGRERSGFKVERHAALARHGWVRRV